MVNLMEINPEFRFADYAPEIFTLDGPSAVGKGTLCKLIKEEIAKTVEPEKIRILDAGHTYRMLTYHFLKIDHLFPQNLIEMDSDLFSFLEDKVHITLEEQEFRLNGTPTDESLLKTPEIDALVARYSGIDAVKTHIVNTQRDFLKNNPDLWWILDGRCMGTAVAPHAKIKVYVDADPKIKAGWRYAQYAQKDPTIAADTIYEELMRRDIMDMEAKTYPLIMPDACLFIWSHKGNAIYNANLILDYAKSQLMFGRYKSLNI